MSIDIGELSAVGFPFTSQEWDQVSQRIGFVPLEDVVGEESYQCERERFIEAYCKLEPLPEKVEKRKQEIEAAEHELAQAIAIHDAAAASARQAIEHARQTYERRSEAETLLNDLQNTPVPRPSLDEDKIIQLRERFLS